MTSKIAELLAKHRAKLNRARKTEAAEPTSSQMREKMVYVHGYEVKPYYRKRRGN
jgi:hypothetical protein